MKRVALVASLLIAAAGITAAGFSNADRLIPGIQDRFSWMRGSCDIWSGWAFLAVFGLALGGLALSIAARPDSDGPERMVSRFSIAVSSVVVGYWLLAAFGNFSGSCIG